VTVQQAEIAQLRDASKQGADASAEVDALREELDATRADLEAAQAMQSAGQSSMQLLQEELSLANEQAAKAEGDLGDAQLQVERLKQQVQQLQQQQQGAAVSAGAPRAEAAEEAEALSMALQVVQSELKTERENVTALKKERDALRVSVDETTRTANDNKRALEEALRAEKGVVASLQARIRNLEVEVAVVGAAPTEDDGQSAALPQGWGAARIHALEDDDARKVGYPPPPRHPPTHPPTRARAHTHTHTHTHVPGRGVRRC
jgi:RND superfamily putative drug exporter